MYDLLRAKAGGLRNDLIACAQKFVQTKSTSLHESEMADLVSGAMYDLRYDEVRQDEDGNIVGIIRGRQNSPCVMLNCHMDTVSPDAIQGKWSQSPFAGTINDGMLYGLGAADCKGGLAAQMYVGGLLKRSLLPLNGTLVVAATVAEENGASIGLRSLLERTLPELGLKPDYAILGEPTDMGLYYGHDGWTEIEIEVEGADIFNVRDASEAIYSDIASASSLGDNGSEGLRINRPVFTDRTGIQRGSIRLERRLDEHESVATVVGKLQHDARIIAQQNGNTMVEVAVCQEEQALYTGRITRVQKVANAWSIDPFHTLVERSRQTLRAAGVRSEPGKWKLGRLGMGTAGGALVKQFGIPTIGFGPGSEEAAHAVDEHVEVENVVQAMYGTAAIVHGLIGIPVYGWTSDDF